MFGKNGCIKMNEKNKEKFVDLTYLQKKYICKCGKPAKHIYQNKITTLAYCNNVVGDIALKMIFK